MRFSLVAILAAAFAAPSTAFVQHNNLALAKLATGRHADRAQPMMDVKVSFGSTALHPATCPSTAAPAATTDTTTHPSHPPHPPHARHTHPRPTPGNQPPRPHELNVLLPHIR